MKARHVLNVKPENTPRADLLRVRFAKMVTRITMEILQQLVKHARQENIQAIIIRVPGILLVEPQQEV